MTTTTTHLCTECHDPIPAGEAVLRSTDPFASAPTAWHRECWAWRMLPAQRSGEGTVARSDGVGG